MIIYLQPLLSLATLPNLLLHRLNLQCWEGELEVGAQVLVDVDVGSRGDRNGRDSWLSGVHVKGDDASGQVDDRVLRHLLGALVHPKLHVEISCAQVSNNQAVVAVT